MIRANSIIRSLNHFRSVLSLSLPLSLFLFCESRSLGANKTVCDGLKLFEPRCCPTQSEYKIPTIAEGETCYVCGRADIAMNSPDAVPFRLSDPVDLSTCAQQQVAINEQRKTSGKTCAESLTGVYLVMSPSICGCEGLPVPNSCNLCQGSILSKNATIPGGNLTCGETNDILQHLSPGGCAALGLSDDFDFDQVNAACCTPPPPAASSSPTASSSPAASSGNGPNVSAVGFLAVVAAATSAALSAVVSLELLV